MFRLYNLDLRFEIFNKIKREVGDTLKITICDYDACQFQKRLSVIATINDDANRLYKEMLRIVYVSALYVSPVVNKYSIKCASGEMLHLLLTADGMDRHKTHCSVYSAVNKTRFSLTENDTNTLLRIMNDDYESRVEYRHYFSATTGHAVTPKR